MDIFTTIYEDSYYQALRAFRFTLLQKLAGDNADKFECFRPIIGGLTQQKCEQKRKAEFVQLFIDMLNAGVSFDDLPTGCDCTSLVGNICDIATGGFADILAGIDAVTPSTVPTIVSGSVVPASVSIGNNSVSIVLPTGATLLSVLEPSLAAVSIVSVSGITGTVTVVCTSSGTAAFTLRYSYYI